jgi:hypothetical protein
VPKDNNSFSFPREHIETGRISLRHVTGIQPYTRLLLGNSPKNSCLSWLIFFRKLLGSGLFLSKYKDAKVQNKHVNQPAPALAKRTGHTKARAPTISVNTPGRYSVGNVMAVSGWSHAKLYQRIREKKFPAPLKDGHIGYWTTDVVKDALGI